MFGASKAMRLLFFDVTVFILIGLWLTGFDKVHWFSYVVPAFLLMAATTGFCPGLIVSGKVLKFFGVKD